MNKMPDDNEVIEVTVDDLQTNMQAIDIACRAIDDLTLLQEQASNIDQNSSAGNIAANYKLLLAARSAVLSQFEDNEYIPPPIPEDEVKTVLEHPEDAKEKLVMAIEDEDKNQKNIILRIIDAIIDAFKKLWNMITDVFKKEPSPEQAKENGNKRIEKIKSLSESTPKLPIQELDSSVPAVRPFQGLNQNLTLQDALKAVETSTNSAKDCAELLSRLGEIISGTKDVFNNTGDFNVFKEKLEEFNTKVSNTVHGLIKTPLKPELFKDSKMGGKSGAFDTTSSYMLENIVSGNGVGHLAIYHTSDTPGATAPFKAKFYVPSYGKTDIKIHLPDNTSDLVGYVESTIGYEVTALEASKIILDKSSQIKGYVDELSNNLKRLANDAQGDKAKENHAVISAFKDTLNGIGQVQTAVATTVKNIVDCPRYLYRVYDAIISAATGKKSDDNEGNSPKPSENK